jgi:mono/diheme cytochrome c family protein
MIKTSLTTLLFVVFLSAAIHGATATQAQTAAKPNPKVMVAAGQEIFNKNCLQCHALVEGQASFGPNLFGELKKPHPKKTPVEAKAIIKGGKNKMPAWDGKLSDADIDNVIAYLKTI